MRFRTPTQRFLDYLHKRDCDVNVVKRMISSGVDLSCVHEDKNTSLHIVIRHCDDKLNLVRELLTAGAPLDVFNSEQKCAVHYAVTYCTDVNVLKELIAFKACVNLRDRDSNSPLHIAVKFNKASFVKVLLDHRPWLCWTNSDLETPLITAVRHGHLEIVKLLLSKGASVKDRGKFHCTPLHTAVLSRSPNQHILIELMKYGAEMYLIDYRQQTPIQYAADKFYGQPSDNLLSARTLVKCAALQFQPAAAKWFPYTCRDPFAIHPRLDSFYEQCVVEKKKMKSELIHDNFYLIDFVRLGFEDRGVVFAWNQQIPGFREFIFNKVLRASMKYSVYTDILAYRMGKPALTSKAMEIGVYAMKECPAGRKKIFLNADDVDKIAEFLSAEDILNLITAFSNSESFVMDDSEFKNITLGDTITYKRKEIS